MLIAIIGMDDGVTNMFHNWGHEVVNLINPIKTADQVKIEPDLVVFTGGADVTPYLYNQQNTDSMNDVRRDLEEMIWYHKFKNVKKLGICRGGQFLNVMEGGKMHQDIAGHGGSHQLTFMGNPYTVTSTHHQGMIPNADTLFDHKGMKSLDNKNFSEIIWYRNSVCFQPHPEYEDVYSDGNTLGLLRVVLREYYNMEIIR
jgi:GMP synthase-like glutamine amidotransferase